MPPRAPGAPDVDLVEIARRVLREHAFLADPPPTAGVAPPVPLGELARATGAEDLRALPWSSIDNEESRDLDQVEVADALPGGAIRLRVGIADVAAFVERDTAVDNYARANGATLYTGAAIFPMLPEALSTDRTSLLPGRDRLVVVTELRVRPDGSLDDAGTRVYPALITNHAKLVYEDVGAWLEGAGAAPADPVIAAQVRLQDEIVQRMRRHRYELGALELDTMEARAVTQGGRIVDLVVLHKSRARELVEDLMIAANSATARFLEADGRASLRRVVRAPRRWDRIVELARGLGHALPAAPAAPALAEFLAARRAAAPEAFADLSLAVVKLLGPGEYVLQRATDPDHGHFGLALEDYGHSTAPNRRFPDLVTQRLLKAAATGAPAPYADPELADLAAHCTAREDAARKVERTMRKVAAAVLLAPRIGDEFDAIVTGASPKGTYARLLRPAAEGRIVRGERGLDVGDRIRVRLLEADIDRGYIDFAAL